ncbi:MAG: 50S ribosomal protein L25, partial [Acidobacteriota bacterium]
MRLDTIVPALPRATRGKNEARRTRVAGRIPAVVYGAFKEPVAIS